MIIIECACGGSMTIEDNREDFVYRLLNDWYEQHGAHRQTMDEYMAKLDKTIPPIIEGGEHG